MASASSAVEKVVDEVIKLLPNSMRKPSKTVVVAWATFVAVSLIVYRLLSDGDFSFLLTYAAVCRCFGFVILCIKMNLSSSASSVSLKTLEAYVVVFVLRLVSILRHEGYLPYDSSGDWFYHVVETMSLAAVIGAIYLLQFKYRGTYDESSDAFGNLHVPSHLGVVYVILPCFLLAVVFHPNLNKDWLSDVSWTFSMYLESLAILPQLYMFQRQASGVVEVLVSHCTFALGFARVVEMAFWMSSFHELSDANGSKLVGYVVLLAQFVHVALMGDFFFFYFISLQKGTPLTMSLPTHSGIV